MEVFALKPASDDGDNHHIPTNTLETLLIK